MPTLLTTTNRYLTMSPPSKTNTDRLWPHSHVLLNAARARLAAVDVAVAVDGHELGPVAAGSRGSPHGKRMNSVTQPVATSPIRIPISQPGFCRSSDSESATKMRPWSSKKMPLGRPNWVHCAMNSPSWSKNLDAVVRPVADEDAPVGVHGDGVQGAELARRVPGLAPLHEVGAVARELHDAVVGLVRVAVGHEDVAVVGDDHVGRRVEVSWPPPASPGVPSVISTSPVGLNLIT